MRNATRSKIRLTNRFCEVHATVHLQAGKRINIDKALVSLLDDLKCGVEQVDAIFIRFVRGAREG